jgi:sigma-B regulation protein RsbU (phosphoserine phosphatase)
MATNLWRDVDALMRLSRSARALEGDPGSGAAETPADGDEFLPASEHGTFVIATRELPARVVSGDLVDAFQLPDGAVALLIADVSGKGIPAGVLRAFTRSIVRHVAHCSASPGETLVRVNAILHDARLDAMFVSLFLGWLDPATGLLRYANAGHPSPLRVVPGGRPTPFGSATGPILGILDVRVFGTEETRLTPGETIVLYTDGVIEARGTTGRFLGSGPLAELVARHSSDPVDTLCEAVAGTVDTFQDGHRHDDATLLAVRWVGPLAVA